ncbi:hypothetical protein Taro_003356 [Colocasia esculenta]|uniref:Uncharacterized protein n=1 Tax=Colocasia esculenta TaxID=4460 RepID=A0A843TRK7_COLES|nr:hypothetical protein [Colocasia esculenta]
MSHSECDMAYTRVIALPGPPGPWAATAKIGSSAWAEGRVLGSLQLDVLRRVSLRSCRGRVRAVRCEEETFLPTRSPNGFVLRVESFARCAALEGLSRARGCYRYLGPPVLGSLLREYSGLRVCSSWQPRESSQQRQGARRAEETGR